MNMSMLLTILACLCFPAFALLFACCRVSSRDCKVERARAAAREKLRVRLMMEVLT